jgi:N-sulfoglucosamine sulfohydrolase
MDQEYDMMRTARDGRYRYIRNFQPELPYAGHIIYRNQSAIIQEWFRLQGERKLSGPPALWMRTSRPAEELYDVQADPHQVADIAGDPAKRAILERMRTAVTEWMARIDDQGLINEAEMIQRMWPGGVQPETARPYIVPRRATEVPARPESLAAPEPIEVVVYVPTQGASIAYTTEAGPGARWQLYTGPILVRAPQTLRAKAIRYGYKESAETAVTFTR